MLTPVIRAGGLPANHEFRMVARPMEKGRPRDSASGPEVVMAPRM